MSSLRRYLAPLRSNPGYTLDPARPQGVPGGQALTADEGAALSVLHTLLGRNRQEVVRLPVRLDTLSPALADVAARDLAVSVVRFLVEGGGYRERTVLREGRRMTGRAWDPGLADGFAPRFTDASRRFWLNAAAYLPELGGRAASTDNEGGRKHQRILRDLVPVKHTAPGDWVFFAMAVRALGWFRLSEADRITLVRRLRQASPVAMLLGLDGEGTQEELVAALRPLFSGGTVRLTECLEDRLPAAWSAEVEQAWSLRGDVAQKTARWTSLGRVLHAWVDAADEARRLDLTRCVARLAVTMVSRGPFQTSGDVVRATVSGLPGIRTVQERDELLGAIGWVAELGPRLLRLREALAAERYGDERYEEAQVFLRMVDAELAPSRRRLDDLARALSGAIG